MFRIATEPRTYGVSLGEFVHIHVEERLGSFPCS